jgi:hypothetical protein
MSPPTSFKPSADGKAEKAVRESWVKVCVALDLRGAGPESGGVRFSEFRTLGGLIHSGYDALSAAGLIKFERGGRVWFLKLTPAGSEVAREAPAAVVGEVKAAFAARGYEAARRQGNPHVECNALYKTGANVNCYLKPGQAIELARHLLQKAQLILDHLLEDDVVHVWNQGTDNEKLYVGLNTARKGPRRRKRSRVRSAKTKSR